MQELIDAATSSTVHTFIAIIGLLSLLMLWIILPISLNSTRRRLTKLSKELLCLKGQIEGVEDMDAEDPDLPCFTHYDASSPKCKECASADSCKAMS